MNVLRTLSSAAAGLALVALTRRAHADDLPVLPRDPSAPPATAAQPLMPPPPPAVPPAQAPPSPPRRQQERPPPPPGEDDGAYVEVHLDADQPGVYLEALSEGPAEVVIYGRRHVMYGHPLQWRHVCVAPCAIRVPSNMLYRIAGPHTTPSDEFNVGPGGTSAALHVKAGSWGTHSGGSIALILGIPAAIIGVVLVSASSDTRTAGIVTTGLGVGLVGLGVVLLATSSTSVFTDGGRQIGAAEPGVKLTAGVSLTPSGIVF